MTPLTPSVARRVRGSGSRPCLDCAGGAAIARSLGSRRRAFTCAPPRQTRPRRRRVRTAATTGSGRLPSVCPPLRSGGGLGVLASTLARVRPAPLSSAVIRMRLANGTRVASDYPGHARPSFVRLTRYRRRCVAPMSATSLRHEHPSGSFDSRAAFAARVERHLTTALQLRSGSVSAAHIASGGRSDEDAGRCSVLAGAVIDSPSERAALQRLYRPPDENATRPLTPTITLAIP